MALRFLQLSDLHLGRQLTGLPDDLAADLREAVREAVRSAFALVRQEGLELVLLPGDLYEAEGHDPAAQLRFIYEQAAAIAPVPVVIAPGNHDAYGPDSPYVTEPRPDNVLVYVSPEFAVLETRAGPVVGRAFVPGEAGRSLDWTSAPQPAPGLGLLCVHASLMHAGDNRMHRFTVVPTTLDNLLKSGYSYAALGHFHNKQEWPAKGSARMLAAYAGCPQGLGWDEPGAKGCLLGELEQGGANLRFVPLARHTWQQRGLRLPPEYAADRLLLLERVLADVRDDLQPSDLLELRVNGVWPLREQQALQERIASMISLVRYARAVDYSAVQWLPELADPAKSEVLAAFLTRCDSAAEASADEAGAAAWRLAKQLGHRLLSGHGLPGEVA
jgi:DNA repair protein SbcD/Mre11